MKLASFRDGSRDGCLMVVDRALKHAVFVPQVAHTLQQALDNWVQCSPMLTRIYHDLNEGRIKQAFLFDAHQVTAPLPRAYQWADGSAYVNHVELVRKARGVEMPANFWTDPLMYQGGSDGFLGPCDDVPILDFAWGVDFESEVAVITQDVALGSNPALCGEAIALLMLVNDVSLRHLIPGEISKGFGFFQSKPASSFSPVAVTPDELWEHWRDFKVHLPLYTYLNDQLFGKPNAGVDMTFDFGYLIAHAAKTRHLGAGSIIGSGTVSNQDHSVGSSCIAEQRMLEILNQGQAYTPFIGPGDKVRIEMLDAHQQSIFGAIDQRFVQIERVGIR
jgi:fumarylacetoacetate (FAA) hydrolase